MKLAVFILGGVVLIVSGVLQALVRPRQARETAMQRVVNAATVRAVFFVLVGLLCILIGTGTLPLLPMGK
jgi:uncharacterized membrane protein